MNEQNQRQDELRTEVAVVRSEYGDFVVVYDHIEECFVAIAEDGAPGTPAGDANTERQFDTLLGAMIAVGQAVERDFAEEFGADETTLGEAMADVAAEATR